MSGAAAGAAAEPVWKWLHGCRCSNDIALRGSLYKGLKKVFFPLFVYDFFEYVAAGVAKYRERGGGRFKMGEG